MTMTDLIAFILGCFYVLLIIRGACSDTGRGSKRNTSHTTGLGIV